MVGREVRGWGCVVGRQRAERMGMRVVGRQRGEKMGMRVVGRQRGERMGMCGR